MQRDDLPTLYSHTKRPQWGLAILAQRTGEKARYLFQDGRLRAFPTDFDHLVEPVDKPLDVAARVAGQLSAQLDDGPAIRPVERDDRLSFDAQIAIFEHLHPDGFDDPRYIAMCRRGSRRRKRQREPLVAEARAALSADAIGEAIERGEPTAVRDAAVALLAKCTAVRARDRRPLERLPEDRHLDFALTLHALLYGDGDPFDRFTRYLAVIDFDPDDRVTWPLATALPALVDPERHIAVKRSVFRKQAAWMAPRLVVGKIPNAGKYKRVLDMARAIRARLEEAGHSPRDLWDVHDFVWMTLRPKNVTLIGDEIDEDEIAQAA